VRKVIYISGPMAIGDKADTIRMAWQASETLRDAGFSTIVPQDNFFCSIMARRRSHDEWLEIDEPLVLRSDALLRLPGKSDGADKEVRWAFANHIPVFHTVGEVIAYFNNP